MNFCVVIIILGIASGLRDLVLPDLLNADNDCAATCTLPLHQQGFYELRGEVARRLSGQQQYFVAASCDDPPALNATVVPWMDAKDPIEGSFVAIYVDPFLENMFHMETSNAAKLCTIQNADRKCVCELSHKKALGAFGHLATMLPPAGSKKLVEMQLAMERSCPAQVPNLLATLIIALLVVIAVLSADALLAWRRSSAKQGLVQEQLDLPVWVEGSVRVKTPMQNFVAGFSWAAGFVMSLAALQTGALMFLRKSSDVEAYVWFAAAFPIVLALLGALRLMVLLCKKQIFHACLESGCILTDLPDSSYLDIALLAMLTLYCLTILCLVTSSFEVLAITVTALGGSAWAVVKTVQNGKEMDFMLQFVETNWKNLAKEAIPKTQLLPWPFVVLGGRDGSDIWDIISSHKPRQNTPNPKVVFQLRDIIWHSRGIFHLTGSRAGFLILPSFALIIAFSLSASAVHMANYACSCGELSGMTMASSIHALDFAPWQKNYEVIVDTSFQQVAVVAFSEAATTRWISFEQPATSVAGTLDTLRVPIEDKWSSAVAEIKLTQSLHPRTASVQVKGLRSSLPETEYHLRFSPLMTIPMLVHINADNFKVSVAWSTLPGSTISIPPGLRNFYVEVGLADFYLGLPVRPGSEQPEDMMWTGFDPHIGANESICSTRCSDSLDCFAHFVGHTGCFFALSNHSWLEEYQEHAKYPLSALVAKDRKISGYLTGCILKNASDVGAGPCTEPPAAEKELLRFGKIRPDWRKNSATLSFALQVEVGGQRFEAEFAAIQLRQGLPLPIDAMGVLLGARSSDASIVQVQSETVIDDLGGVTVNISKFDPMNFSTMRLLVMPLLPDRAFQVNWTFGSESDSADMDYMKLNSRCLESGLVKSRYAICGATGSIPDKPITVLLSPWTGQPDEALLFTVVPKKSEGRQMWPNSEDYRATISYHGVDSPAAWAAEIYGCSLMEEDELTQHSVIASADAICYLLPRCTSDKLCRLIDEEGLAGGREYGLIGGMQHPSPLLSQEGILKVMACLKAQTSLCNRTRYTWAYHHGVLRMTNHGATVTIGALLAQVVKLKNQGIVLLQDLQLNLLPEGAEAFYQDMAQAVWTVPTPSDELVTTLATMGSKHMPGLLVHALIQSQTSVKLPNPGPQLQAQL